MDVEAFESTAPKSTSVVAAITRTDSSLLNKALLDIAVLDNTLLQAHAGHVYTGSKTSLAVADTVNVSIFIKVGAIDIAFAMRIHAEGKLTALLFEAPTTSADGVSLPLLNNNRASTNTPLTTTFVGPTVSDLGLQLLDRYVSGGTFLNFSGGLLGNNGAEWILKANTNYLMRMINTSGAASDMNVAFSFCEVP